MGQGIAHTILLLAFVIGIGLYLGRFKVKGISLGTTWILFAGILMGHLGFKADLNVLHFVKEFGLILFVFSIGLQVGPGFFHSFRSGGVKMNLLAVMNILLAVAITWAISAFTGEQLTTMVGVMSGAVTNTPGLGAAQQTFIDVATAGGTTPMAASVASEKLASAYAVAYLGMPVEAMPLYAGDARWHRKASRIQTFVLAVGNFGHNRDQSYYSRYPYLIRKTISLGQRLGDLVRHTQIFPLDSLRFFPSIVFNGLRSAVRGE